MYRVKKMRLKKENNIYYFKFGGKRYFGCDNMIAEIKHGGANDKIALEFIKEKEMLKDGEGFQFKMDIEENSFMDKDKIKEVVSAIRLPEGEVLSFTGLSSYVVDVADKEEYNNTEYLLFKYVLNDLNGYVLEGNYIGIEADLLPINPMSFKYYNIFKGYGKKVVFKAKDKDTKSFVVTGEVTGSKFLKPSFEVDEEIDEEVDN